MLLPRKDVSALGKKKKPIESYQANVEEVVMNQPLLLMVYDYRKDGRHAIIGKINTTTRELKAKARQFDATRDHSKGESQATRKRASTSRERLPPSLM